MEAEAPLAEAEYELQLQGGLDLFGLVLLQLEDRRPVREVQAIAQTEQLQRQIKLKILKDTQTSLLVALPEHPLHQYVKIRAHFLDVFANLFHFAFQHLNSLLRFRLLNGAAAYLIQAELNIFPSELLV